MAPRNSIRRPSSHWLPTRAASFLESIWNFMYASATPFAIFDASSGLLAVKKMSMA